LLAVQMTAQFVQFHIVGMHLFNIHFLKQI
jgi:hypothetical protein